MLVFHCKKCGTYMEAADSWAGQKMDCPSCRAENTVPEIVQQPRGPVWDGEPPSRLERSLEGLAGACLLIGVILGFLGLVAMAGGAGVAAALLSGAWRGILAAVELYVFGLALGYLRRIAAAIEVIKDKK